MSGKNTNRSMPPASPQVREGNKGQDGGVATTNHQSGAQAPAAASAAAKKKTSSTPPAPPATLNLPTSRYESLEILGRGAYGVVFSAKDKKSNESVAIKKIDGIFSHDTFTRRTLREIRILRLLSHDNIIGLRSVLRLPNSGGDDLYLVFELMETDLASIIKSKQPLSNHHVQFFMYQLLRGLKFIHTAGIIHRDIKPRNLLVNSNCDLKICDLGLARLDTSAVTAAPAMTDYVATRWYRAPEIILQWSGYTAAIDMWAVGCILAELLTRKPLFPGNDADHQMQLIADILGRPNATLIARSPHVETRRFLEALAPRPAHPLSHVFRNADFVAVDLLIRLLKFDPAQRSTVEATLKHQYLAQLACPEDEPSSEPIEPALFPFDSKPGGMKSAELRKVLDEELVMHYKADNDELEALLMAEGLNGLRVTPVGLGAATPATTMSPTLRQAAQATRSSPASKKAGEKTPKTPYTPNGSVVASIPKGATTTSSEVRAM